MKMKYMYITACHSLVPMLVQSSRSPKPLLGKSKKTLSNTKKFQLARSTLASSPKQDIFFSPPQQVQPMFVRDETLTLIFKMLQVLKETLLPPRQVIR